MEAHARLVRIVVTGSESTGKTTLAAELAQHFGTVWCPEFVRGYAEDRNGILGPEDVEPIARGQAALEAERAASCDRLLFQDTDLLSTLVYARHYYGTAPAWLEERLRSNPVDLYLLLRVDVPWVADGQRDRGDRRDEMHALFRDELRALGLNFIEIGGTWAERRARAIEAVEQQLGK